jgi:Transcriptional regulatory protein, C terminal
MIAGPNLNYPSIYIKIAFDEGHHLMNQLYAFVGALNYEFRMQIRRRSVWITFIAMGLLFTQFHQPWYRPITTPAGEAMIYWTQEMHSLLAIVVGILLADRLPRDRRTRVEELLATFPGALGARLGGKYIGSTLAMLDNIPLELSPTEFSLLHLLLRSPGRAFSRAYLLDTVWGETYVGGDRSVDNTILRLRKKLGALGETIETVWGIGYRLQPERH